MKKQTLSNDRPSRNQSWEEKVTSSATNLHFLYLIVCQLTLTHLFQFSVRNLSEDAEHL